MTGQYLVLVKEKISGVAMEVCGPFDNERQARAKAEAVVTKESAVECYIAKVMVTYTRTFTTDDPQAG